MSSFLPLVPPRLGQRGAAAAAFAASAVALFGSAALAMDVGGWYLGLRHTRNAADAAALAGAAAAAVHGEAQGRAAAFAMAASNGFAAGSGVTVTVNLPPTAGTQAGNAEAVEVTISQRQGNIVAGILGAAAPTLAARAVAMRVNQGDVCVLALGGAGLQIGGNSTVVTPGCVLASNRRGADSVRLFGSAIVTAESIQAVGECDGCATATLTERFREYAPPSTNPFARLDAVEMPQTVTCAAQPSFSGGNRSQSYAPSIPPGGLASGQTPAAYCSTVQLSNGDTLSLQPGIYYFWNASLRVSGGNITCPSCVEGQSGVAIVFTGNNPNSIGTARMDGNGTMRLFAGPNQGIAAYNGILFHRDARATSDSGFDATIINGGSDTFFAGGQYFPSSTVTYNGNMATGPNPCTALAALSISVSGTASTTLDNTRCSLYGTTLPMTTLVRLVE
ncbi:MAG TPA: pilus assembly protein TadG-related protein [Acetobacteraceae bacterium]|nr:pilus assembly protein TadG-related protein [Acetobacteraceae bacterium]